MTGRIDTDVAPSASESATYGSQRPRTSPQTTPRLAGSDGNYQLSQPSWLLDSHRCLPRRPARESLRIRLPISADEAALELEPRADLDLARVAGAGRLPEPGRGQRPANALQVRAVEEIGDVGEHVDLHASPGGDTARVLSVAPEEEDLREVEAGGPELRQVFSGARFQTNPLPRKMFACFTSSFGVSCSATCETWLAVEPLRVRRWS